jgi:hypothetical protein
MNESDKHSSLLQHGNNYDLKKTAGTEREKSFIECSGTAENAASLSLNYER